MPATNRPNILFLFSDQQRWDTVDCYGAPLFPGLTPNLDQMAADGVRFKAAFTCQPVCGPARAALQTGQYPAVTGCFTNARGLPPEQRTIAHAFNDAGYRTSYIGKWHLAQQGRNSENYRYKAIPPHLRGGYQSWLAADCLEFSSHGYEGMLWDKDGKQVDFEGYRPDCLTDFTLDYLRDFAARPAESPFFLFVSYIEPHHQNDLNRFIGPIGSKQRFAQYRVPGDLQETAGDWRQQMPDYLGCCWSLDQNVGRIRHELNGWDWRENTLVIYGSDHGCHFCTRNSEYKRSCHDNAIRIPLLACGPSFRGGRVVNDLVSLIDLPPTFLAAAGIPVPATFHGRSLLPLAGGQPAEWPDEVFLQISESQVGRAIRTRRWKYAVRAHEPNGWEKAGSSVYCEDFLYDLEADPFERHNLVADPARCELRKQLAQRLIRRMVEAGEAAPEIRPATGNCPTA